MPGYRVPTATYRLQFNRDFTFNHARALVPYLHQLGISDIYASPIFQAKSGSTHGYDVTDPNRLNPELGTEVDFDGLVEELKSYGMGLLLDIVPNHMAATWENPWWADLLENGPASQYAGFFDVDWPSPRGVESKVVVPILGKPYSECLTAGDLDLQFDGQGFCVRYYEHRLPINIKSYGFILTHSIAQLDASLSPEQPALLQLRQIIKSAEELYPYHAVVPDEVLCWRQSIEMIRAELVSLAETSPEVANVIDEGIATFSGAPGDSKGFDRLHALLIQQPYRLAYWRTGSENLNYRRFFDISDLAGVRVEDPDVFAATHALVLKLVRDEIVTGLRLDHIDGLYDPNGYLQKLRDELSAVGKSVNEGLYVVVEKILSSNEKLRQDWPVSGTTGYDFLNALNSALVDREGFTKLENTYHQLVEASGSFTDTVYKNKKRSIDELLGPEFRKLWNSLVELARTDRYACDLPEAELGQALREVTACLPVYRTYGHGDTLTVQERDFISTAIGEARIRCPQLDDQALDLIKRIALGEWASEEQRSSWRRWASNWNQFTGPVMAKGFEDTSLYNYFPLISLNEVGGSPTEERLSVEAFHRHNSYQHQHWPYSLNPTSTHDTKRSEDVRARINVLSEIPEEWEGCLQRWTAWNRSSKREVNGQLFPELNTEVLLYQTLLGAWPLASEEVPQFKERLKDYLIKAAREAKAHTSWTNPDTTYEESLIQFTESVLEDSPNNSFLPDFLKLQERVAYFGALNSLSQTLLKITAPGVPDLYRGTELWDFTLVDPDNRRPIDFEVRGRMLSDLSQRESRNGGSILQDLLLNWRDGSIKLYLTCQALQARSQLWEVFRDGDYIPLGVSEKREQNLIAFARHLNDTWAVTATPRLTTQLVKSGEQPIGCQVWDDDLLTLPEDAPLEWENVFTGETVSVLSGSHTIPLFEIFKSFPVALLVGNTQRT